MCRFKMQKFCSVKIFKFIGFFLKSSQLLSVPKEVLLLLRGKLCKWKINLKSWSQSLYVIKSGHVCQLGLVKYYFGNAWQVCSQ